MSQRGPNSRPSSRPSSYAQSTEAHASPPNFLPRQRPYDDGGTEHYRDSGGGPVGPGHEPPRQATPRTIGVHAILNPSDPREQRSGPSPSIQRPGDSVSSPSSAGTRQYGVSGSPYQAYGPGPLYGGPPGPAFPPAPATSVPPPAQQESPTPVRPYHPTLDTTRRILTPRPHSFSRSATPSSYADPQPPLGFPPPSLGRPGVPQDGHPYGGPPSNVPQQSPRTNPLSAVPPGTAGYRSFSQPPYSSAPPFQFPLASSQAGSVGRSPQGPPAYPQGQYGLPQGRTAGPSPPGGPSGDPNLSTAIFSALQTGGGVRGSEVQPHLTLQTNTGEHITVPLDVHQGSRQADEKRHRNAGASARFRARKKERDKDMRDTLQRLESENREVSRHAQDLQAERDFYRNERNRLREIVSRIPEIREHAERGPPSPRSSRVAISQARPAESSFGSSFAAGGNPPTASPSPMQSQHPPPYSGELERPTRRRRTDPPAADLGSAPYPMRPAQPPSTLPPIATQGFSTPIASAPPSARLPPLRFDQHSTSPTTAQGPGGYAGSSPGQPPVQAQFPPYGRQPHETGWATGPREPQDGQHRSPGAPGQ